MLSPKITVIASVTYNYKQGGGGTTQLHTRGPDNLPHFCLAHRASTTVCKPIQPILQESTAVLMDRL